MLRRVVAAGFAPGAATGGGMPGAGERVMTQLRPWFTRLASNALPRWLPALVVGTPCHIGVLEGTTTRRCANHAVGNCGLCGRASCLSHSFVNELGEVVCFVCVVHYKGQGAPPPPPPPNAGNPRSAAPTVAQARKTLGVSKDASWEDVVRAYKRRVLKTHPDRGGTEEKFRKVQEAFETLKEEYGG